MIEDLAIVHLEDFAFGVGDQHVVTAHIGPVAAGVRRGQITLLPPFDVVFGVRYIAGTVSPMWNWVKSAVNSFSAY